jgi:uncharacterized membrane protein
MTQVLIAALASVNAALVLAWIYVVVRVTWKHLKQRRWERRADDRA